MKLCGFRFHFVFNFEKYTIFFFKKTFLTFKNLTEKFSSQINDVNCQELCKLFVKLYVENRMDETSFYNHVQEVLGKILHRRNL